MDGLLAHVDSHKLARADLKLIPLPEGTETFKPIAHAELVDSIHETLSFRHINVVKGQLLGIQLREKIQAARDVLAVTARGGGFAKTDNLVFVRQL